MEVGVNWMPLGYSPNASVPPTEIVFVGFGVSASGFDEYSAIDVRDKIVMLFESTPDAGNPHSAFARFNIHTKANLAKDKGARAIILIAGDSDFRNDRLSKLAYERSLGETAIPVVGVMRSHAADLLGLNGESELTALQALIAAKVNPRPAETWRGPNLPYESYTKATAEIKIELVKKTVDAYNVIGILPGIDPQLKDEAIVIGAHYDHLGHGGSSSLAANSTEIHYGADDNASGTSAVLELAREFATAKKNKRTLIFMAFGGEEEGLLGSKHYVNNPVWPIEKTIAMINLDMVGRLKENKLTIGGVGTASEWRDLITESNVTVIETLSFSITANSPTQSTVSQKPGPGRFSLQLNEDGFGPSDHSSFYGKQIPVLFFFTGTHTDYHKPSDTPEKINFDGLLKIYGFVYDITAYLAGYLPVVPVRPTYAVVKSSGQMGEVRLTVSLGTIPSYADSTDGMVLDGVRENSPAAKAGLKAGDKVIKLAGKDVRNAMDYTYVLGSMKPGEEYEIVIKRGNETMTMKVIPAPPARRQ
jgi:aminopeptidase YwaD